MTHPSMETSWLPPSRVYDTTSQYPQVRLAPTEKGCAPCALAARQETTMLGKLGEVFRMSPDSRRNLAGLGGTGIGLATLGNVLVLKRGHLGSLGALSPEAQRGVAVGWGILSAVSSGASAYHGYRRNRSVGWAIAWGVLGALFPVITPAVALAQGFARPASGVRGIAGLGRSRRRGR